MEWKELWLKNYKGEGDTQDLATFIKKLNYGNRNNISYLPWATVERIFRLQGGKIEIVRSPRDTIVEADRVLCKEQIDENGVVQNIHSYSFFVNIKTEWQGQVHIEKYPLQDGAGRPVSIWTQNEVNKAIQRGKVKAIAIVSGIGFKLFEDGDLQFEEEVAPVVVPQPIPAKLPATPKPEVKVEETKTIANRVELENEIKKQFLSGSTQKAVVIKDFLTKSNAKKMGDLNDTQIKELFDLISK